MTLFEEALMMLNEANQTARAHIEDAVSDLIDELIVEAVKRLQADHDALVAEHAESEAALVRATSLREQERLTHQPTVRWQEHHNNTALGW